MTRRRLPNRRPNETVAISFEGRKYAVTIGFRPGGSASEVFTHGAKVGSTLDALLDDACVAVSLLLQHGAKPADVAASMCRIEGGRPASVIGAVVDLVAEERNGPPAR